jgi:hypothetical protein
MTKNNLSVEKKNFYLRQKYSYFGKRNLLFVVLIIFLFSLTSVFVSSEGYWAEPSFSGSPICNGYSHVMCAENGAGYDSVTGKIPYHDALSNRSYDYCAIYSDGDTCSFGFKSFSNLSTLKNSSLLCGDVYINGTARLNLMTNYDGVYSYYDENCNGDEQFIRVNDDPSELLDLSKYVENNVSYDVTNDESNIDGFDIVSGVGTLISGTAIDSTGHVVSGVNFTLYFKNAEGVFEPYRNMISDVTGAITTLKNTTIKTYYNNYSNIEKIPCTKYILVGKHANFTDSVTEFDFTLPNCAASLANVFVMQPASLCEVDCTLIGSNLCAKECDGRNGCEFAKFPLTTNSTADYVDDVPKDIVVQRNVSGIVYDIPTCTGTPYSAVISKVTSECSSDKEVWKESRLVTLNGKVIRMTVTVCK